MTTENTLPEDKIVIRRALTRRTLIRLGWIILLLIPPICYVTMLVIVTHALSLTLFVYAFILSYLVFAFNPIGWVWYIIVFFALHTHFQNKRKAKSKARGAAT